MNEIIHDRVGTSPLGGLVLVAQSALGVCAILPGDNPGDLIGDMMRRFPGARFSPGGVSHFAEIMRLLATPAAPVPPLDMRGTPFRQRVWKALRRLIPPGTTRSYGEVAAMLGVPGAARAVASACAANPLAVAVPCHRVVGWDGRLSGYAWGAARKHALLALEAAERPDMAA